MSAVPTVISTPPTHRIEELFVSLLSDYPALSAVTIVPASDRDAVVGPSHVFVYCTEAAPVMNAGQNYRAKVVIASVGNIDDNDHATRRATFALVLKALSAVTSYSRPDSTIMGWAIESIRDVSIDQQTADVITLNAAVYVAG